LPFDARTAAAPACTVLDTDFGDGGRFLALWHQWRNTPGRGQMLHYVGLLPAVKPLTPQPADPLAQELARALSHLNGHKAFHRLLLDGGQVSLTLCLGEAQTALAQQSMQADIVYLNALSPAAPPLAALAKCCKRGTRLQLTHPLAAPGADAIHVLSTLGFRPDATDTWVFDPAWPVQRSRQAPRRLASYSLDSARLDDEDVTEGLLQSAVRRTAHGTLLIADLVLKTREPEVRPGFQCRWCPANDSCEVGAQFLRQLAGEDDESD
jgi:hypothetical protein